MHTLCFTSILLKFLSCTETILSNMTQQKTFLIFVFDANGHTTSNPRRFDVDITSIRRRPNFDKFPRYFRVLFRCNFAGRKIHVVSTYFFRFNFAGRKIHLASTYFSRCNFAGRKNSRGFHELFSM